MLDRWQMVCVREFSHCNDLNTHRPLESGASRDFSLTSEVEQRAENPGTRKGRTGSIPVLGTNEARVRQGFAGIQQFPESSRNILKIAELCPELCP